MEFYDRIYHKIKLKKDAVPFRPIYDSMSFEKRKAMKKIVEDLERDNLVEPTHLDWEAPSILVPKEWNLSLGYRLSSSEQTNREKHAGLYRELMRLLIHWRETCTSRT